MPQIYPDFYGFCAHKSEKYGRKERSRKRGKYYGSGELERHTEISRKNTEIALLAYGLL